MNLKHLTRTGCALVIYGILLTGCGSTTVVSSDGKTTATVNSNGTVMKGTSGDASFTMNSGASASYPATFGLPQYPGSKVSLTVDSKLSQANSSGASGASDTVMLTSSDQPGRVMEHYKSWMESNGWKIEAQMNMGEGGTGMLTATKDTKTASVMTTSTPGAAGAETSITLSLQTK